MMKEIKNLETKTCVYVDKFYVDSYSEMARYLDSLPEGNCVRKYIMDYVRETVRDAIIFDGAETIVIAIDQDMNFKFSPIYHRQKKPSWYTIMKYVDLGRMFAVAYDIPRHTSFDSPLISDIVDDFFKVLFEHTEVRVEGVKI